MVGSTFAETVTLTVALTQFGGEKPALHVQALLPAIEFEFGPHAVQLPGPVDALNLPTSQFTHTPGPADVLYLPA